MKDIAMDVYLLPYIISNIVAVAMLLASWKRPRILRVMFFLLFAWAGLTNWIEAAKAPQLYLDYADLTFIGFYHDFIRGWFSNHIRMVVSTIAVIQAMIAVSMLAKGWITKIGAIGGIVFLISIIPLGIGSAFPCTLIMAVAMLPLLQQKHVDYLWMKARKNEAYSD